MLLSLSSRNDPPLFSEARIVLFSGFSGAALDDSEGALDWPEGPLLLGLE